MAARVACSVDFAGVVVDCLGDGVAAGAAGGSVRTSQRTGVEPAVHRGLVSGKRFAGDFLLGDAGRYQTARFVVAVGAVGQLRASTVVHLHRIREVQQVVAQVAGVVRVRALPGVAGVRGPQWCPGRPAAVIVDRRAGDFAIAYLMRSSEKNVVERKAGIVAIRLFGYLAVVKRRRSSHGKVVHHALELSIDSGAKGSLDILEQVAGRNRSLVVEGSHFIGRTCPVNNVAELMYCDIPIGVGDGHGVGGPAPEISISPGVSPGLVGNGSCLYRSACCGCLRNRGWGVSEEICSSDTVRICVGDRSAGGQRDLG